MTHKFANGVLRTYRFDRRSVGVGEAGGPHDEPGIISTPPARVELSGPAGEGYLRSAKVSRQGAPALRMGWTRG